MVGPRTAAPRAPRPSPTMPPSNAWLPVRDGAPSPPKKNFSSTSVGLLLVFLLAEEGELPLLLDEDETLPLNLSWHRILGEGRQGWQEGGGKGGLSEISSLRL